MRQDPLHVRQDPLHGRQDPLHGQQDPLHDHQGPPGCLMRTCVHSLGLHGRRPGSPHHVQLQNRMGQWELSLPRVDACCSLSP